MLTVNKVTIIGYVGKEPTIVSLPTGKSLASFNVATTEYWNDKNTGEKKQSTEWHRIISFISVDFIKENVHSGSPLYLEGSIKKREYLDNGEKKTITEIIISIKGKIILLESNKELFDEPEPQINDFPKNYDNEEL